MSSKVVFMNERLQQHWDDHAVSCLRGLHQALVNNYRIRLAAMGQMELPFEEQFEPKEAA